MSDTREPFDVPSVMFGFYIGVAAMAVFALLVALSRGG